MRDYLSAIVAACLLLVPATALVRRESLRKLLRMLGGALLLLVILRPLVGLDMQALAAQLRQLEGDYALDVDGLTQNIQNQMASYIKEATEAYIEEKAEALGALLQAEVKLSAGEYPTPVSVRLIGTATPEQVAQLGELLAQELGLPSEKQEWRLYDAGD